LTVIEAYAFSNCKKLTELLIPKTVSVIGNRAFEEMPDCIITILNESDDEELFRISQDAFGWNTPHIKEVCVPWGSVAMRYAMKAGLQVTTFPCNPTKFDNPKKYEYVDGVFCCLGSTLHQYFGRQDVVCVPEGICRIESSAFWRSNIKKVILPNSVEIIDEWAFSNCSQLEEIKGKCVKEIDLYAFDHCEKLKWAEFPKLQRCFDISFEHCNYLKRENIIIPQDAEIIEVEFKPCGCGYQHAKNNPFALGNTEGTP